LSGCAGRGEVVAGGGVSAIGSAATGGAAIIAAAASASGDLRSDFIVSVAASFAPRG
jgi:hypothetical protein